MKELKVAVIGGDQRQIAVINTLVSLVKKVKVYGQPKEQLAEGVTVSSELDEILSDVQVVILPISGVNEAGMIRGAQSNQVIEIGSKLATLPSGTLLVTGSIAARWAKVATKFRLQVLEYAEMDEVAIPNAIPTAEGAVQLAMEELPITIHGSTVVVVGFGRVAVAVAQIFKALQAKVIVAARRVVALEKAAEMGFATVLLDSLDSVISQAQIIINTVPALVINAALLQQVSATTLIIDLASAPGGIDFEAAEQLKLKAILALGLPGKVAPQTAGIILAQAIPNLIRDYLQQRGED